MSAFSDSDARRFLEGFASDREHAKREAELDKLITQAGPPLPEDMAALEKLGCPFPMKTKTIPEGWRELHTAEIIRTDDQIWQWDTGPWIRVGGSLIGERYKIANSDRQSHWTIIRQVALKPAKRTAQKASGS